MLKKIIFLLCLVSIALSLTALSGGGGTVFDKENLYDPLGNWKGCPEEGTTCAHFPPN